MAVIGQGISLRGMTHEKFHYPFNLASGITRADIGKAVSLDTSAANTVKLAATGDKIIGQLVVVEDRSIEGILVGTVAMRGGFKFTQITSPAFPIAVGDSVIGGGSGLVRARMNAGGSAKEADHADNIVVEIEADGGIVVVR